MFFRNLTLMRFPTALAAQLQGLAFEEALSTCVLREPGPLELSAHGFVSPFGSGELQLSQTLMQATLVTVGISSRLLPTSVLQRAVNEKIEHIRETEARNPGGRERKRLRDEVLTALLPQAFVQLRRVPGYLDLELGWAVVDTSSRKQAEAYVSELRTALGSFPAVPANAENSARALMTAWVDGEPLPSGFALGEECELRYPVDTGAVLKCRNQDLQADEVREHLACGKQVFALALSFEDRLSFVLGEDLVIRKLRFLDAVTESLEGSERETQREEFDAVSALQIGELRRLLIRLDAVLQLSKAEG